MKDKVASILGESKSTYASSLNKVSNSNNEDSNSENKPRFYRREINSSETNLTAVEPKEQKRIGNNFRIIRSPGRRNDRDKAANIVRVNEPNRNVFSAQNQTHGNIQTPTSGPQRNLNNFGLLNNTFSSRNNGFNRKSQLQFKCLNSDQAESEQIISEKYGSKQSTNLGQIKEENRENGGSQATMR
jgi:hypothetical protein